MMNKHPLVYFHAVLHAGIDNSLIKASLKREISLNNLILAEAVG